MAITCFVKATDSSGNEQTDDDSAQDYYAMDVTKPQYVDVVVVPVGTLKPGAAVEVPVQIPDEMFSDKLANHVFYIKVRFGGRGASIGSRSAN